MEEHSQSSEKQLRDLWLDPSSPIAFSGRYHLLREAKKRNISEEEVDRFLEQQIAYTRHFPKRYKFPKHFYNISKYGHLLEYDLAEITGEVSKANKNIRYLLVAVEGLSRKLFVEPLKNKTGRACAEALEKIFKKLPPIEVTRSDLGREWRSHEVQDLLKSRGIIHKYTSHQSKAALAERAIQTLQRRISRFLTYKNTYTFLPELKNIVDGINQTVHATTGYKPNEVNETHAYNIWERVFLKHMRDKIIKPKFKVGDTVRLALEPSAMTKSYRGNYTQEVYRIKGVRLSSPPTYQLEDLLQQPISGESYQDELVKVKIPQGTDATYEIDRILERRKRGGQKQVRVTWRNYPRDFSEWISANQLEDR